MGRAILHDMTPRPLFVAALIAMPALSQAPAKSLPQHIADDFIALAGGVHPGYRINHAKGIVLTGTFAPSPGATALSRAPHLSAPRTPVIVRFSDPTGVPTIPDKDPHAWPKGIAVRFSLANGAYTDIVSVAHNGFVVGTGEDFAAFLDAAIATKPDSRHPNPVEQFLASHPHANTFVTDPHPLPVGFETETYYGNNAFIFVNAQGVKQAGRTRIVPVDGEKFLSAEAAAKTSPDYLFDEIPKHLPFKMKVVVQVANPGDQTKDGSDPWPEDRKLVELGVITVTTVAPNNAELQRTLAFNPIYLSDGIQLSDDPLPVIRSAVYALSVVHRRP
jgi:catalase